MVNFGSSWLKGRLICFVAQQTIQPVIAEGWTGLDDGSLNLLETRHPVLPSSNLERVIQQGMEAFGNADDLNLSEMFAKAGLNVPEQLIILPLKISDKTKILFIAQPSFSMDNPETLSTQTIPLVTIAHDIGAKLEDMIRLSKIGKLPELKQRIPKESEIITTHEEDLIGHIDFFMPSSMPASSEPNERMDPISEASNVGEYVRHFDKREAERVVYKDPVAEHPVTHKPASSEHASKAPNPTPAASKYEWAQTNERAPVLARETLTSAMRETLTSEHVQNNRPVPVSFDASVHARREKESSGVNIIMPIGVEDAQANHKQTLLGGFSADDVIKAGIAAHARSQPTPRDTLQGFSVKPERDRTGLVSSSVGQEDPPMSPSVTRSAVYKVDKRITTVVHQPSKGAAGHSTHSPKSTSMSVSEFISLEASTDKMHAIDADTERQRQHQHNKITVPAFEAQPEDLFEDQPPVGTLDTLNTMAQKLFEEPEHIEQQIDEVTKEMNMISFVELLSSREKSSAMIQAKDVVYDDELADRMIRKFPGALYIDRYQHIPQNMPSVQLHGPMMAAFVRMGEDVASKLRPLLQSTSLDVRFYSTFLFSKIPAGPNLDLLYERIHDRDLQIRQAAVEAISFNRHHSNIEHLVLTQVRRQIDPSSDDMTIEMASQLAGVLQDVKSIEPLIHVFRQRRARTVRVVNESLQRITLQNLPASSVAWQTWWKDGHKESRTEWVLRGINASNELTRNMVAQEIEHYPGFDEHYHPKMIVSDRLRVQQSLKSWFESRGML